LDHLASIPIESLPVYTLHAQKELPDNLPEALSDKAAPSNASWVQTTLIIADQPLFPVGNQVWSLPSKNMKCRSTSI
jgi:hypothetical protein